MFIYTLLAILHDSLWVGNKSCNKIVIDNDTVCVIVNNKEIINKIILPFCEDMIEDFNNEVDWSCVSLTFGKNPFNKRPELQLIYVQDFTGFGYSHKVSNSILQLLASEEKDELYYELCEEIFYEILS